jgi:hypothetical protein
MLPVARRLALLALVAILAGCQFSENRHLARAVKSEELVERWRATEFAIKSLRDVGVRDHLTVQEHTLLLNSDGSCSVQTIMNVPVMEAAEYRTYSTGCRWLRATKVNLLGCHADSCGERRTSHASYAKRPIATHLTVDRVVRQFHTDGHGLHGSHGSDPCAARSCCPWQTHPLQLAVVIATRQVWYVDLPPETTCRHKRSDARSSDLGLPQMLR